MLRHWSSTDDFLINVTTFGRPPGVSDVIGDFTKTHLYRAGADQPTGFADQARGAQRGLRAALTAPESTDLLAAQLQAGTGHSGIAPVVFTYAADTTVLQQRDADTLGAVGEVASMTPQVIIDNQVGAVRRQPDRVVGLPRGLLSARCRRGHVRCLCQPAGESRRPRLVHARGNRAAAAFTADPPTTQRHNRAEAGGAALRRVPRAGAGRSQPDRAALGGRRVRRRTRR